ncbi:MAG: ABC transporter ATP-binding protein [Balneolaceae bacterium]
MISFKNVSFAYKKGEALLSDINFELRKGNVYGILGLNGAGKTTLLNLATGMLFPESGSCQFNGEEVRNRTPKILRELFIVPEQFDLPKLSGEKYTKIHQPFYPKFVESVLHEILTIFEVDFSKKLSELSYGQRKKFLIAFSIASNARMLFFDEPTNGLDIPSKSQFRKVIASLDLEDRSILISTHQVRDLGMMLDHIIVIKEGTIVFNQSVEKVTQNLKFKKIEGEHSDEYIYGERTLGGVNAILPATNGDNSELDLDMELLFNGIIQKTDTINKQFGGVIS